MDVSRYLRIPYRALQSDFRGCDCYGLVGLVYREELGREVPVVAYQQRRCGFALDGPPEATGWERIDKQERFALILFRVAGLPAHCGVMLDDIHFLHAYEGGTVSVGTITDRRWATRLAGFWRLKS